MPSSKRFTGHGHRVSMRRGDIVRDFSDEALDMLLNAVAAEEAEREKSNIFIDVADFFSDLFSHDDIRDYANEIEKYYTDIVDHKHYSEKKIKAIFEAANRTDAYYASKIAESSVEINRFRKGIQELSSIIDPSAVGGGVSILEMSTAEFGQYMMSKVDDEGEREIERINDHLMQKKVLALLEEERFSKDVWKNASKDERQEILREFYARVNEIMGTSATGIEFSDEEGNEYGHYSPGTHLVTINTDHINSYELLPTIFHELRHAYQHDATDSPNTHTVSKETIAAWEMPYISYDDNQDAYYTQPREWDSRNFANRGVEVRSVAPPYLGSWEIKNDD
jgi:hypothetical protein